MCHKEVLVGLALFPIRFCRAPKARGRWMVQIGTCTSQLVVELPIIATHGAHLGGLMYSCCSFAVVFAIVNWLLRFNCDVWRAESCSGRARLLSSENGTHTTAKARFWPWPPGQSLIPFQVVPSSLGSGSNNPDHARPPRKGVHGGHVSTITPPTTYPCQSLAASERRRNNLKRFRGFYLNAKTRIWP